MHTPFGDYSLQRYPRVREVSLRAWNTADELLLQAAAERGVAEENILVVNDEHGAISVPLAGCCVWTDSKLSELAILANLEANKVTTPVRLCAMDKIPAGNFQLVLLRVPKHGSLLRYQLQLLRQLLPAGTPVLCAGMDKHLSPATAALLEEFLGPTQRHPGKRKARLFSITVDKSCTGSEPEVCRYHLEQLDAEIESRVNVFSREKLDAGSRLMLTRFAQLPASEQLVDLGCGNGVLGVLATRQLQPSRTVFCDESALALASARGNVESLAPGFADRCEFLHSDGLLNYTGPAPQLILCNPPFHQQHVVNEHSGQRMIQEAAAVMAPGGELWLVANRHLPYARLLQQLFNRVKREAQDSKFIVWRAVAAN
jgi:16S rRNA G1207 methylase RsmC